MPNPPDPTPMLAGALIGDVVKVVVGAAAVKADAPKPELVAVNGEVLVGRAAVAPNPAPNAPPVPNPPTPAAPPILAPNPLLFPKPFGVLKPPDGAPAGAGGGVLVPNPPVDTNPPAGAPGVGTVNEELVLNPPGVVGGVFITKA